MHEQQIEAAVARALAVVPEKFRSRVSNLAIVVEDEPDDELAEELGSDLLGLLDGPSLGEQGLVDSYGYPTRLVLFARIIAEEGEEIGDWERAVRETVWHELAHYFGFDEDGAERLEQKWEADWQAAYGASVPVSPEPS